MKQLTALIFVALLGICATVADQTDPTLEDTDTVAIMKASFLFHFSSSNNWPTSAQDGNFVIGVFGSNGIYEELFEKYSNKPIGSQQVEVIKLTTDKIDKDYHILFVDDTKLSKLKGITKSLKGKSTLIVSDHPEALAHGADFNFVVVDSKIRYEINQGAVEGKDITLGSKILSWAVNK